ncbi:DNA-binding response regulator [Amycolatopsis vastitatis]|uniref:DNA-binding response regulator n=2 Tax=Amycolatopsis vastitatis TaxID=1905142 RepID=A0A229SNN3_9PSEU|nr:DNA-binding response regulator [Amycolatopsis vastitatis]
MATNMTTPDNPTLRVVVADDQAAVREGLVTLLDLLPDIAVVGAAADGDHALTLVEQHAPDVVLMDLRMPGVDGIEATRRIHDHHPATKIVVLTTYSDDTSILDALRAGALGYLTKDAGRDHIAQAIRTAAAGQAVLDPTIHARLLAATAHPPAHPDTPPSTPPDGLTTRETEVLTQLAAGHSNSEIAQQLFVSETTIKTHINHIYAKIGAADRAQAVRYAYQHHLTQP